VPQSICVRYGLPIGAWMSPVVLVLMYIMGIAAWPTAKLLDYLLGEDHGTVYKKTGLKALVTLHQSLGHAEERLNEDEVTIITAVLDLKTKAVGNIMTPMKDVFTMSSDTVLDEKMMDNILSAGYSRIPIHNPGNKNDFVGMLLVKMLITYDPEDALRVRDFALATLPETRPETSCLDILNFFQEGKSHMVLVSDFPAEARGAVGVVTLEDVIEELIGEEIIDESDVFIDVHKAIRRMAPAPRARVPRGRVITDVSRKPSEQPLIDVEDTAQPNGNAPRKLSLPETSENPQLTSFLVRRRSSGNQAQEPIRSDDPELYRHLKHLGPSNAANRPKSTRINTVKIKPANSPAIPQTIPENERPAIPDRSSVISPSGVVMQEPNNGLQGGVGEGLLTSAGREASDGVHSVAVGYGTMAPGGDRMSWKSGRSGHSRVRDPDDEPQSPRSNANGNESLVVDNTKHQESAHDQSALSLLCAHRDRRALLRNVILLAVEAFPKILSTSTALRRLCWRLPALVTLMTRFFSLLLLTVLKMNRMITLKPSQRTLAVKPVVLRRRGRSEARRRSKQEVAVSPSLCLVTDKSQK
jgi:metal transporter CNNM